MHFKLTAETKVNALGVKVFRIEATKEQIEKAKAWMHSMKSAHEPLVGSVEVYETILSALEAYGRPVDEAEILDAAINQWRDMETAPKDGTVFVCRAKNKPHVTFEAAIFQDQESYEIPEIYDVLQNMTVDEPIADHWIYYEWMALPKPPEVSDE